MLGQVQARRKTYLNIREGKVVRRTKEGEEYYSYVEGRLESIYSHTRSFRGEEVEYWYIDLSDEESGELYSIGFPYSSNVFKSIVLSLASAQEYSKIKIMPYEAGGKTKIVAYAGGEKLNWISKDMPPLEEIQTGGRTIKDDTKRMRYIGSLVGDINMRVRNAGAALRMPRVPLPKIPRINIKMKQ